MADDRYTRLRSLSGRLRDLRDELEDLNDPYETAIGQAIVHVAYAVDKVNRASRSVIEKFGRDA